MKSPMTLFISGGLTGAPTSRKRDLMQAEKIHEALAEHWGLHHPAQWRVKHLRWFLAEHLKFASSDTRYRYWLTVKKIITQLKKEEDWTPLLKGPWTSPSLDNLIAHR